jgi:hypothetical protein
VALAGHYFGHRPTFSSPRQRATMQKDVASFALDSWYCEWDDAPYPTLTIDYLAP